jgi:hypothetical protein
VDQADGFDITLCVARSEESKMKLFFLNLGGYDPGNFGELHENLLLVATDVRTAMTRSLKRMRRWSSAHRDKAFEVEKSLTISDLFLLEELLLR